MKNLTFIRTTILVVIASLITYYFTMPLLDDIKVTQDQTFTFSAEIARVSQVNQELANQIQTYSSIPLSERQKLRRLLPSDIDDVSVMRDMEILLNQNNITPASIGATAAVNSNNQSTRANNSTDETNENSSVQSKVFNLDFESSTDDLKNFLRGLEFFPYLLDIEKITLDQGEDLGIVSTSLSLKAYFYPPATTTPSSQ